MSGWVMGGAAIVGGGLSYMGSKEAADAAGSANDANAALQRDIYEQTRQDLMPYMGAGQAGLDAYTDRLGLGGSTWDEEYNLLKNSQYDVVTDFRNLIAPNEHPEAFTIAAQYLGFEDGEDIRNLTDDQLLEALMRPENQHYTNFRSDLTELSRQMEQLGTRPEDSSGIPGQFTLEDLVMDPGYQFRLNEGMKGLQSSSLAGGMGLSGATLKGVTDYNQNFASNEFMNAFNRNQTELSNLYNLGVMGQNSAVQAGTAAQNYGSSMSDIYTNQANMDAASAMAPYSAFNTAMNTGLSVYSAMNPYGTQMPSGGAGSVKMPDPFTSDISDMSLTLT